MTKKISIQAKPTKSQTADDWVKNRSTDIAEPIKRLTIDIPESLHRKIKGACAIRGNKISYEIRALLIEKYGDAS